MAVKKNSDSVFEARLKPYYDELKWLYMELYNDEHAFAYFIDMLRNFYEERPAALRKWDEKRTAAGSWYSRSNMLGMLMYVNAFAKMTEGTPLGTLLEHLHELNVHFRGVEEHI